MFTPANRLAAPNGRPPYSELHEMRQPLAVSAGGHLALLLLAVLGLPFLHAKPLAPVKTISINMIAPSDAARTRHVAPPTPVKDEDDEDEPDTTTKPPVLSSLTPPPPPPPQQTPEKAVTPPPPELPPPPPAKSDIAPIEKLKPVQQAMKPLPQVTPMPALQKPLPVVKPPPAVKPPEKVTPKQDQDFQSLVTNLAQPVEKADQVANKASHHPHQSAIAEASNQMTADELSALREALKRCWIVPAGVMNAENLVVVVEADYNENMTMKGVPTLVDSEDRYNRDPAYRAAADSALRALRNPECATLPFPPGKYDDWHHINLTFDPKTMMTP